LCVFKLLKNNYHEYLYTHELQYRETQRWKPRLV
jgi:hypothetical protein